MTLPRRILVALPVLAVFAAGCSGESPPPASRNVVLVCLDTVRFDTMFLPERAGVEDALTSDLERAVVFSKAHAAAPWTVPSVSSTLTGLYPAQHGAGRFDKPVANLDVDIPSKLDGAARTLAERLADAGFATPAFVAHPWFKSGYGMEQGFDELHMVKGSDKLADAGASWLDEHAGDGRFFLYLHFMGAHDKHLSVSEHRGMVDAADPALISKARATAPGGACDDPDSLMCRRYLVYAVSVAQERRALARVLEALRERGLMKDTIVMVYADHGEEFHDHLAASRQLDVDPRDIFGFGHGNSLYQEQLHVPLIAWHPDLPGQRADGVVSLVDVVPTLLQWVGLDTEADDFAGRAATGLARGDAPPFRWEAYDATHWPPMDRPIYASGIAYGPNQLAVLADGWKYVWHEQTGETRLFNLRKDPEEKHPVADADALARLEPALDRYFEWYSNEGYEAPNLTADQLEELKGVGYLQGAESGDESDEPSEGQ